MYPIFLGAVFWLATGLIGLAAITRSKDYSFNPKGSLAMSPDLGPPLLFASAGLMVTTIVAFLLARHWHRQAKAVISYADLEAMRDHHDSAPTAG